MSRRAEEEELCLVGIAVEGRMMLYAYGLFAFTLIAKNVKDSQTQNVPIESVMKL